MTTVAQIKRVTRPLLERNSDLAPVGRIVVIKPVRHLLCRVLPDERVPRWLRSGKLGRILIGNTIHQSTLERNAIDHFREAPVVDQRSHIHFREVSGQRGMEIPEHVGIERDIDAGRHAAP